MDSLPITLEECREVIDAIPVYVWSALPDGRLDFVNSQWEAYTGLPSSAALGWSWQQAVHPDDVERHELSWRQSLGNLRPMEEEIRVRNKEGGYRWWLVRAKSVLNRKGEVLKWYGAGFDIDNFKRAQEELRQQDEIVRKRIEQELRDTIDAMPVLFGILASDANVEYFNKTTLDYYGLRSEEMIGFNWQNVVHPDDLSRLVAAHLESFPAGRSLDIETRCRRADGEYRWLIHRIVPRHNEQGEIIKWYGTSFDVEDRKRAEEALLEQRVAERTRIARELHDTLLQDFAAMLHIFGATTSHFPNGPVRDQLEHALEKGERSLSEGREAIQGLRLGMLDGEDLITALRGLGQNLFTALKSAEAPAFQVAISGPTLRLRSFVRQEVFGVASEAIRNAFRHASAKRIQVQIEYGQDEFTLAVIDDGVGVDARVLSATGDDGHFGLLGMRERARIVGGKLSCFSEAGCGTTIELKIPSGHAYGAS